MELPVQQAIPEIRKVFASGNRAVLSAPPGAGKTTIVPPELRNESWLHDKKIIMLEPRRLAAVAAATRMAELLGEPPGETVGYIIRGESAKSRKTRTLVVTEGVLTQMLQDNPELPNVGLIIFDEFHERSLQADLGLALALDAQENLREDLRLLIMSATLDVERISTLLDDCPTISAPGLSYPVETVYGKSFHAHEVSRSVAAATVKMAKEEFGNILVFLPGAGEIRAVYDFLKKAHLPDDVDVRPLYSGIDKAGRNAAIRPPATGRRKIVLATSVAETSLTIEGVRVVIDSGLSRLPRMRPSSGLTMLETVRVSKASADQRRGRAGRLEPGICLRLWSEFEHQSLPEFTPPEILASDAVGLRLELARWGTFDPAELKWLDSPPEAIWNSAGELLTELGLLDPKGRLTAAGRAAARLPVHPRLGAMLLRSQDMDLAPLACAISALLEEPREIFKTDVYNTLDLSEKIRLLASKHDSRLNSEVCRRVIRQRDNLLRLLKCKPTECSLDAVGILTAFAYPDRIGKRRDKKGEKYLLSSGSGAVFRDADHAVFGEYIVAPLLGGHGTEPAIFAAAPMTEDDIRAYFGTLIKQHEIVEWDRIKKCVIARRQEMLEALVLKSSPLASPPPDKLAVALCEGIRQTGLHVLPWNKATDSFRERAVFAAKHDADFADFSDDALLSELEFWLSPFLAGMKNFNDLRKLDLKNALENRLGYNRLALLKRMAPEKIKVPSGSKIWIDYSSDPPTVAVKLQEMFSCNRQPTLMDGRIPLKITLLSPAMRPVQTTSDIVGFWTGSYQLVRVEMKSRYPKHNWPENPATAKPSARTVKPK